MSELSEAIPNEVTLDSAFVRFVDGGDWPHFEWRVTVKCEGRSYTTDYRTGIGHVKPRLGVEAVGDFKEQFSTSEGVMSRYKAIRAGYLKPTPPALADVLSCFLSEASAADSTFESWCDEFGYDTDSRKALDMYLASQKTGTELRRVLGAALAAHLSGLEH